MDKILSLINKEKKRQKETLMLIPSENFTYPEVRKAVGSVLMHKYSEGQPAKRYYQGNQIIDEIENFAKSQALQAFGLSEKSYSANVQPHSGSEANLAVYNALLKPGDKILAMHLPDGGHLSHGWHFSGNKVTFVSKIYSTHFYRVDKKSQRFNYQQIALQAKKLKPKLIISGGTAYTRQINHQKLSQIAKSVNGFYLADIAHEAGLIAAGVLKSPFPHADVATMTTHKTLRGPRGAIIISKKSIAQEIDRSVFPGLQGGPHNHTIAGIAIALQKTKTKKFKNYAAQVIINSKALSLALKKHNFNLISGGTDTHLVLIDLRNKNIPAWFAAHALEKAGLIVNRNAVPYDTSYAYYPSGIRLGTPAITVQGMKEPEMVQIAAWFNQVVKHLAPRHLPQNKDERAEVLRNFKKEISTDVFYKKIQKEVKALCQDFPAPLS